MKRSRLLLAVSVLSLAAAGVACGGGGDDSGGSDAAPTTNNVSAGGVSAGGTTITVSAKEFSFDPKEFQLQAGRPATVVIKNTGAVEHDITLDAPTFKVRALPTKTAQAELVTPSPGNYTFYCSVPGHRAAGMEGTVTVS